MYIYMVSFIMDIFFDLKVCAMQGGLNGQKCTEKCSSYTRVLHHCNVLYQMGSQRQKPNRRSLGLTREISIRSLEWSSTTFKTLLHGLCNAGLPGLALQLAGKFAADGKSLDEITRNMIIANKGKLRGQSRCSIKFHVKE